ncbi:protein YoaL [Buttiauxella izardii]|uniref:protein YoaL n=1 Tax=Buttiauxella izardii TaxID=82991 RepID=UPI003AAD34C0
MDRHRRLFNIRPEYSVLHIGVSRPVNTLKPISASAVCVMLLNYSQSRSLSWNS